jgi:hypothetical protein
MPNDLDTTLKERTTTVTTRQHYEQHSQMEPCRGCHMLMDPIGFAFERYDGFGRYRDQENGMAVDTSGTLYAVREGNVNVSGMGQLASYLAGSDDTKNCMVRYWSYYAYGSVSWAQDACTYDAIRQEAAAGAFGLKSVLKAIIHAPRFTRRVQGP